MELKEKIEEALETLESQMTQLRRQKARLLKELYEEDTEAFVQEKGVYDLSGIKEFDGCLLTFKCPLYWEDLEPTKEDEVRYCDVCRENVYHAPNFTAFKQRVKEQRCVAVNSDDDGMLLGIPEFVGRDEDDEDA